jgi:glutamate-1-semialdehyde aminotransferase
MATQQSGAEASEAADGSASTTGAPTTAAPTTAAAGTAAPQAAAEEAPTKADLDETKRKFREALERKRGNHASAQSADHTGKVHGSHGPAASRRSFRRKSGG